MKEKPQIFMIHGGSTFKNREDYLEVLKGKRVRLKSKPGWYGEYLDKELGKSFDIIRPTMPLKENAMYEDWKIVFEKYIPLLNQNVVLVGSSLGGIFLAKWLSENEFSKNLLGVYLIAPPFDNTLPGDDLVGGFEFGGDLGGLKRSSKRVKLFFAKEDPCVLVEHAEKYREKLGGGAYRNL